MAMAKRNAGISPLRVQHGMEVTSTSGRHYSMEEIPIRKPIERAVSLDSRIELPLGFRFQPQWITNTNGNAFQVQLAKPRDWAGGFYGAAVYRKFGYGFDVSTLFNNYGTEYHERALEVGFRKREQPPVVFTA